MARMLGAKRQIPRQQTFQLAGSARVRAQARLVNRSGALQVVAAARFQGIFGVSARDPFHGTGSMLRALAAILRARV
jgi:hypothetical protein